MISAWACSACDPTPNPPRSISVTLLSRETKEPLDSVFYMIYGGTSTQHVYAMDTLSAIQLPIDFRATSVGFVFVQALEGDTAPDSVIFDNKDRRFDTLIVDYETQLVVLGPDCGYFEAVRGLSLNKSTFDSTVILSNVLAIDSVNVKIFL